MPYRQLGEVLEAERPGLFGLSLFQLGGAMAGYMVGVTLGGHWALILVGVLGGVLLLQRRRGVYVAEDLAARLVWVAAPLAAALSGPEAGRERRRLDPGVLYARETSQPVAETYILRRPDGEVMSISVK